MSRTKRILSIIIGVAILVTCISTLAGSSTILVNAAVPEEQVIDQDFVWRYLDDNTDPNIGTFYEGWNIRFGWTFPLGYMAYGVVPMNFFDTTWSDGTGPFSFDDSLEGTTLTKEDENGNTLPTYFFRATFTIEDPSEIVAIAGTIKYNDAAIIYINGKPIEQSFNIPNTNYPSNLSYGCNEKLTEIKSADFIVEDVSMLLEGDNVVGVELHTSDPEDTDVYFEMESLVLNPSAESLPDVEDIKTIAVHNGEDESQLNFAWYSLSDSPGQLQIADKADMEGDAFPSDKAKSYTANETKPAYTKFYDKHYYYNQATISNIERNKEYIYRVGNDDGWSDVQPLSTKDISDGYEILFISDPQIGTGTITTDTYGWQNTLNQAFELYPNISFIANPGDVVDSPTKESEYDAYFTPDQLKRYPSAVAVGNHDIAANFGYHYNLPNESDLGRNAAAGDYYFTYGNVLYIVLNGNNTNNSEHAQFIEETMKETEDQEFSWKVVMLHQSLYCAATQSTVETNIKRREELVPVIDKFGIDIALMGHDHSYVRTHHMKNFEIIDEEDIEKDEQGYEIDPEGTLYLTMSSASGSKYYDLVADYDYSAVQLQLFVPTFAHLEITDDTFTMTTYRTDTMDVIDEYTMKKTTETTDPGGSSEPSGPSEPSEPSEPSDPSDTSNPSSTDDPSGAGTTKNPKTGDVAFLVIVLLCMASVAVLVVKRKKTKINK